MSSGMEKAAHRDAKYAGVRNYWGDPEQVKKRKETIKKWLAKPALPLFDRLCKLCGCPLHMAQTVGGHVIPLDLRSHIYAILYDKTEVKKYSTVVQTELAYVSHFYTCPFTNELNKKNAESDTVPVNEPNKTTGDQK